MTTARNIYSHDGKKMSWYKDNQLSNVCMNKGYRTNVWITLNQVRNRKGVYKYKDIRIKQGEIPVSISGFNRQTGLKCMTNYYNLDQTNFPRQHPIRFAMFRMGLQ